MSKTINLGAVTAYADAVAAGYTGTREEFAQDLANAATYAEESHASAETASAAAETASTAATTATTAASSASDDATTAHADAEAALSFKESAETAAGTATTKAGEAANSASQAATSASGAAGSATAASGSATAAAGSATNAAESETAAAGSATAAAGSASAAAQTLVDVNTAGATQVAAIAAKGAEVLESIPSDYTELSQDVDDLKSAFNACFDSEVHNPTNLLDISAVTFGKYCTDTGAIADNASYWYTDFIPVEEGETYTRQRGTLTALSGRNIVSTRWISCYDNDKNILADKGASDYPTSFTVPSGVAYLCFSDSTYMNAVDHPTVVKGTEVVDYSEYFAPYTSRILKAECNNDEHINEMITERMQGVKHTTGMVYEFNINSDNHELNDTNTLVEDMFDYSIQFDGRVTTFNGLTLGHGNGIPYGGYVKITPTHFEYYMATEANPRLSEAHNLTIADYISVRIDAKQNIKADFTIYTNGGVYTKTNQTWDVRAGRLFVNSNGINVLTGCTFAYMCRCWGEKVHLYGDSYFGVYNDKWTNYLTANNWNKCNVNAYPGRASAEALRVAKNVLNHSNPEMIVWCMGMNDGDDGGAVDATWKACVEELESICSSRGIELILATIPNVQTVDNTAKNAYVVASEHRYIDFASAVGASSGTTWYENMLSNDGIHPSEQGAISLFNQAIADVPELMQ